MRPLAALVALTMAVGACAGGSTTGPQLSDSAASDGGSGIVTTSTEETPGTSSTTVTTTPTTTSSTAPPSQEDEDLDLDPSLRTVEVLMTEMAFEPSNFSVQAGETVQFVLRNQGVVEHEFRLTTQHAAEEHIASGHEGHDDEDGGHSHDEMSVVVDPGEVAVFTVTFQETGAFDTVACLIPGHFEAGMHAPLTYESG